MTAAVGPEIAKFLAGSFPNLDIGDDDDLFDGGIANSLFTIQLIMFVEKRFAVQIPNEDLELDNFRTVTAMTKLVERLTQARSDV
ncbi:acyl carrier protein [Streptomyces roseirectus]|uniref:Acyl carrier protein n=1 Tax=Streptomyces roseirectus TaxID=2768066 RepID=A0A7H0IN72_9ACTN|nr:acyl carrier protein [Streptomyces roseirectus]QNP74238.1 acyl carrier protein [Streptomyces roseirectus]